MTDKNLIAAAILLFIAGLLMYRVLGELFGIYSLIITLPLACAIGWATGSLIKYAEEI